VDWRGTAVTRFSNDDRLSERLAKAGVATGERVWRMPLGAEYDKLIDSKFADMKNTGGRWGGAITAACFLWKFAKDLRWAHLDIAGTAWLSGSAKGSTGRPVPLLVDYCLHHA